MAMTQEELFKLDLYGLLGLETNCSLQDVKRAFRKKALKCHPDKNPDNPNAAQLFHQLSCALEILSDTSARAAYDKILNARKAAQIRNQQLDSRRKKLKEDLEERERNANSVLGSTFNNDELKLQAEIERLRKEGSRLLQEEINRVQEQLDIQDHDEPKAASGGYCLTVHWKAERGDVDNGGYSEALLRKILSKYGEIEALVFSLKRRGRAIVEFTNNEAAMKALCLEKGLLHNPLIIEKLDDSNSNRKDMSFQKDNNITHSKNLFPSFDGTTNKSEPDQPSSRKWPSGKSSSPMNDQILENNVLERLRQMERMKRRAEEKCE